MKENAYFTVEAALVLPVVIGGLVLTVFLFLFQYDRCLLEQDMNMLAICAGAAAADSREELQTIVQRKISEISMDKYVAWEMSELRVIAEGDRVSVRGGGNFISPLPAWNIFNEKNQWSVGILRETRRISPSDFVRLYRKIKGGK